MKKFLILILLLPLFVRGQAPTNDSTKKTAPPVINSFTPSSWFMRGGNASNGELGFLNTITGKWYYPVLGYQFNHYTGTSTQAQITAITGGYVPTSRTLTINGTAFDLSANRTWTVTPTGTAGGDLAGTYPNPTINTINSITKSYYDPTSSIQNQLNVKLNIDDNEGISTLAYGAVPDGTTDNTAALTTAINGHASASRPVYFPQNYTGSAKYNATGALYIGTILKADPYVLLDFTSPSGLPRIAGETVDFVLHGLGDTARYYNNTDLRKRHYIAASDYDYTTVTQLKNTDILKAGMTWNSTTPVAFEGSNIDTSRISLTNGSNTTHLSTVTYAINAGEELNANFTNTTSASVNVGFYVHFRSGNWVYINDNGAGAYAYHYEGSGVFTEATFNKPLGFSTLSYNSYLLRKSVLTIRKINDYTVVFMVNGKQFTEPFIVPLEIIDYVGFANYNTGVTSTIENITKTTNKRASGRTNLRVDIYGDSKTAPAVNDWPQTFKETVNAMDGIFIKTQNNYAVAGSGIVGECNLFLSNGIVNTDVVIVSLATNDIQANTPIDTVLSRLNQFYNPINIAGKKMLVIIPTLWYSQALANGTGQNTVNYAEGGPMRGAITYWCASHNVKYVNLTFKDPQSVYTQSLQVDNIHPQAELNQLDAVEIAKSFMAMWQDDGLIPEVPLSQIIAVSKTGSTVTSISLKEDVNVLGSLIVQNQLALQNGAIILNKAQNNYIPFLTRNTTGSEALIDITNVGTITTAADINSGANVNANGLVSALGIIKSGSNVTNGVNGYQQTLTSNYQGISGVSNPGQFRWYANPNNSLTNNSALYQLRSYAVGSGEINMLTMSGSGDATFGGNVVGSSFTGAGAGLTGTAPSLTAGTVTTNANFTGPVTSTGNATAIANGAISNAMLANSAVANLSNTNSGDNAANNSTMYIGTTPHALNRASAAEGLTGITSLTPGADFSITQNSINPFTSVNSGAVANTLYLNAGKVGVGTNNPLYLSESVGDITYADDITNGDAQFSVAGSTTRTKRMTFGYATSSGNGFGFIKSGNQGIAYTPIYINPTTTGAGGGVCIGCNPTITTPPTAGLFVQGNTMVGGDLSATTIIKSGGLSTQFLMADGSTSTAGTGPVFCGSTDGVAQTTAINLSTFTVGASDASFMITANLNITAIAVDVIQTQVAYTDETNTSRTLVFYGMGLTSAGLTTTGVSNYAPIAELRAKAGTVITVSTVLTTSAGSITYNAHSTIYKLR